MKRGREWLLYAKGAIAIPPMLISLIWGGWERALLVLFIMIGVALFYYLLQRSAEKHINGF